MARLPFDERALLAVEGLIADDAAPQVMKI